MFVMASFAEGVPVVLMEAMAAGLPVIAPRIAGIAELVEDGRSGFLTPPGDAETLAEKIAALLSDGQLRQSFGQVGRAMVERQFNLEYESAWLERIMSASLAGERVGLRPQDSPRLQTDTAPRQEVPAQQPANVPS